MQNSIDQWIDQAISSTPVYDLHTHVYPANFANYMLWGIDELLTYHYLVAETMRFTSMPYEQYWNMNKTQQADLIWKTLFVEHAPISEACRGVLTVLNRLGLDVGARDLKTYREFFRSQKPAEYFDKVLNLSNVHTVVMTNSPFDPEEHELWMKKTPVDPRLKGVLRLDPLLLDWPKVGDWLNDHGYKASADLGSATMKEIRRFLTDWIDRLSAIYCAVSLPPAWRYPDDSPGTKVINEALLPVCRERNIPFAMMIGVNKLVNPELRLAGDSLGKADIDSVQRICAQNQKNKFLVTMLSRENQHELAVTARKNRNLLVFGCWWFMNNPIIIEEMTRMRMELLGESFVPQHSDARVLDQLIYKWDHSRAIIGKVLKDKYRDLAATGWKVTQQEIQRTVKRYLNDNFVEFLETSV